MKKMFRQHGMTLLELTVVLLILIGLAGLAVPYIGSTGSTAMCQATDATMQAVKAAIVGGPGGAGYYADMLGQFPRDRYIDTKGTTDSADDVYSYSLYYLFVRDDGLDNDGDNNMPSTDGITNIDPDDEWRAYNPKTGVGWRGPYLQNGMTLGPDSLEIIFKAANLDASFTDKTKGYVHYNLVDGQSVVLDGWGRPLVLQVPDNASCDKLIGSSGSKAGMCARLISAGAGNGLLLKEAALDTLIDDDPATTSVIEDRRTNDDRMLYLRIPSPAGDENVPCDQI